MVYLFYHLVLQRMTFYNWNRWYLISYTILCFFIPFIDVSFVLADNNWSKADIVRWVPIIENYQANVLADDNNSNSISAWNMISLLLVAGMSIMFIRLLVQLFSFRRLMQKAQSISDEGMEIYQVNENIIPFSFGKSIFINRHLHSENELQEIILHEFVHVKQRHSIDIIWSEILCLLNWYNPFVWLIRKSIRQNLEFIADNKVVENGVDRKKYQYLLLKVIGNNHFSIAPKFNFSSLKKRIAMMNKNKSTKMHLLRFLFVLPVLALILVSFRKEIGDTLTGNQKQGQIFPAASSDTIPDVTQPNSKGYIINVKDKKGECLLVIKDKSGKEVKRLLLTEWNANQKKFEATYGKLPPPPQPPKAPDAPSVPDAPSAPDAMEMTVAPTPPLPPVPVQLPANVENISITNNKAVVTLKNGQKESYDLSKPEQKDKFEKKYVGFVPSAPSAPAKMEIREVPVAVSAPVELQLQASAERVNIIEVPVKTSIPAAIQGNPLIVVDGVIVKNGELNNINPNSIESINILKGSSATAAYGEKGSNGVIVIKIKTIEKVKPITQTSFLFSVVKNEVC